MSPLDVAAIFAATGRQRAPPPGAGGCGGSTKPISVGQREAKNQVLPGIEPVFRNSESPVITVTLQDHMHRVGARVSASIRREEPAPWSQK